MPAEIATPPAKSSKSSNYWQQTMQNRMLLIVLSMVVLIPLLALPSNPAMQNFANYALRVMAALLAGILVLRARFATNKSEVMTFLATGANLPVLLFLLDAIFSLAIAPRDFMGAAAVDFMRTSTGVLLYFALAYHVRRSEHLVKIQDALVFVSGLISLLGLTTLVLNMQATQASQVRGSLFGDHQLYGAMMMMLFPVTLVAAITEKRGWRQIAAQAVAAITFVCLLITETRTSWAGAVGEVIVLLIFAQIAPKRSNGQNAVNRKQYVIPALIVATCAVLFVALGGASDAFNSRLNTASSNAALEYRSRMWYAATEMIKSQPLIGHGLSSFAHDEAQISKNGRLTETILQDKGKSSLGENAHSFWLQTGAEQGILGICLYASILVTFLVAGINRLRFLDGGIRRWILLASMAAIVGFAVDALGNPGWEYAQISMFFWLMLGLGVAGIRPRNPRGEN